MTDAPQLTHDRLKKEARRIQKAFAQHIDEPQPSYTWCRAFVQARVQLALTDREALLLEARKAWKARVQLALTDREALLLEARKAWNP